MSDDVAVTISGTSNVASAVGYEVEHVELDGGETQLVRVTFDLWELSASVNFHIDQAEDFPVQLRAPSTLGFLAVRGFNNRSFTSKHTTGFRRAVLRLTGPWYHTKYLRTRNDNLRAIWRMIMGNVFLGVASVLSPVVPKGTRSNVFQEIYSVFLLLGTVVGIVVVAYMLHKAYKYRAAASDGSDEKDRPELGELPSGSGGGRKLFVSFTLSAIIVVSLITWTYFTLLYVESPDVAEPENTMEVEVVGHQFYWEFVYPNGHSTRGTLRVPEDTRVKLTVTSDDVFHNFGVPELRAKADAIPGERTTTWFMAPETGNYSAHCYELCGSGHSYMDATVQVMPEDEYEEWYAGTANATNTSTNATTTSASSLVGVHAGV